MNTMLTTWKSIAVFLDESPLGEKVGAIAVDLAKQCGAHLIGIHNVESFPGDQRADCFARGKSAIDSVIARQTKTEAKEREVVRQRFTALSQHQDISTEFRTIGHGQTEENTMSQSLHCDLVVLGHPKAPGLPDNWTADRLLIASGVPVLVIPDGWGSKTPGRRILVAWNASREARRAIADAMPLLSGAEQVTVLVVDADKTPEKYGEDPGADISLYLTRHGARVDLLQISSAGSTVAETILATAASRDENLIVIGAYSHTRRSEAVFGGVTRSLLARTTIPLLLSR